MSSEPQPFRIKSFVTELGVVVGVTAVASVICGVLNVPARENSAISLGALVFLCALWWRRYLDIVPSSYLVAALVPFAVVIAFFLAREDPLFEQTKRAHKPYELQTVTYFIRLEPDIANPKYINESHRLVYGVRATRTISQNEQVFLEEIHTHHQGVITHHWNGSERELPYGSEGPLEFQVLFPLDIGKVRTVVTGADFKVPYPFHPRDTLGGAQHLGPTDDLDDYPNSQGDIIDEFVIIVESLGLNLKAVGRGAGREGMAIDTVRGNEPGGTTTLIARCRGVKPNETVWLHYDITPKREPPTVK
jgi:hypothetical protein